jgi:hypothetical protein
MSEGGLSLKTRKRLIVVASVLLVLVALVLIANNWHERRLEEKIKVARAAGFPIEGKDVGLAGIDDQDNAAPIYERLASIKKAISYSDIEAGMAALEEMSSRSLSLSEWQAARRHVKESQLLLDQLVVGSKRRGCYFEKDWNRGADIAFPEYSELRRASDLVLSRAKIRAAMGDAGFIEDIATAQRVAAHVKAQPPYIALSSSISMNIKALSCASWCIPFIAEDKVALERLRGQVASFPESFDLTQHLRCEAFSSWWCANNLELIMELYAGGRGEMSWETVAANSGALQRSLKELALDVFTPVLRDYDPYDDDRATIEKLTERVEKAPSGFLQSYFFSLYAPGLRSLPNRLDGYRAQRTSILAAIDVLLYRQANGNLPNTLAEAGIEAKDSFAPRQLGYRLDSLGFRVWSVGVDLTDNGGKTTVELNKGDDQVLLFPPRERNDPNVRIAVPIEARRGSH